MGHWYCLRQATGWVMILSGTGWVTDTETGYRLGDWYCLGLAGWLILSETGYRLGEWYWDWLQAGLLRLSGWLILSETGYRLGDWYCPRQATGWVTDTVWEWLGDWYCLRQATGWVTDTHFACGTPMVRRYCLRAVGRSVKDLGCLKSVMMMITSKAFFCFSAHVNGADTSHIHLLSSPWNGETAC